MTFCTATASPYRVVVDGQSLNGSPTNNTWPHQLLNGNGVPWKNVSIAGTSWTNLKARAAQEVFPLAALASTAILILGIGGESDLIDESDSGATLYADLVAYSTAAKAAGFDKVMGLTIPPSTTFTAGQNTARGDANSLILADASAAFDSIVDVTVSPLNNAADTTYYSDGLHLTSAGAAAVAALVGPALDALLV